MVSESFFADYDDLLRKYKKRGKDLKRLKEERDEALTKVQNLEDEVMQYRRSLWAQGHG